MNELITLEEEFAMYMQDRTIDNTLKVLKIVVAITSIIYLISKITKK